ncbi:rhomboid family intramembrane serine protease [Rariglobus hedericola]|nr:rhomboid family intramembrane serine protease [Rariglobus hedericola]
MPTPEDSQLPDPARDQLSSANPDLEEHQATKKVLHVWSLLEGRFPLVCLLLVIASVAVTISAHLLPDPTYTWLYTNGGEIWIARKWWGLLGSAFIHSGVMHLVFNCYWIWLLGRLLERELGSFRFLLLFLGTAAFSSIAELAIAGQPGVGMSGVAYAFFGFLLVNQSRHPDFRRVLSGNTRLLMIGWLVACFALTYTKVLNIANFAHLGGLVSGLLVGAAWYPHRFQKQARAACLVLGVAALAVLFWAPWQPAWQAAHAYRALIDKDEATALLALEKIRAKDPANVWALSLEIPLRLARGEYALTRDLLNQLISAQENPSNLNHLAWILATCPEPEVRDGARAIKLARRACDLDGWKTAAIIDTLAAAYAETGDFIEAEKQMIKAMETPGEKSPIYQAHLDLFRAHKPVREHPPSAR